MSWYVKGEVSDGRNTKGEVPLAGVTTKEN